MEENVKQEYILRIANTETCALYDFLQRLESQELTNYQLQSSSIAIDIGWLKGIVKAELEYRFKDSDTTVERYCNKRNLYPLPPEPGPGVLPLPSGEDPSTTNSGSAAPVDPLTTGNEIQSASFSLGNVNWWKIGFFGLLIYTILKRNH